MDIRVREQMTKQPSFSSWQKSGELQGQIPEYVVRSNDCTDSLTLFHELVRTSLST